jgi:hypothetical protein
MTPRHLEAHVDWRAHDVADPASWTVELDATDLRELDAALAAAKRVSDDLMAIGRDEFPLDGLAAKLALVERELIDGRGFVRLSALPADRFSDDDLTLLYWGIGMHLGDPWPQNKHGHVMGDVTDQGRAYEDPEARGNEIGSVALGYHTDGSDLVGLMCLRVAKSGGLSCVANAVAIYNQLVRSRPDLVAALYEPLPYDYRGEQPEGSLPFYLFPVFSEHESRIFIRFIPKYIYASQRHAEAPRLAPLAIEALETVSAMAADPQYNVMMDLRPGEMQFINNYHVLHGRTAYVDDPASGRKRHLKRLWLAARRLTSRPSVFGKHNAHWARNRSISRIRPVPIA